MLQSVLGWETGVSEVRRTPSEQAGSRGEGGFGIRAVVLSEHPHSVRNVLDNLRTDKV